ncbi:unnamed protein product, partial [Effrenium voratum]
MLLRETQDGGKKEKRADRLSVRARVEAELALEREKVATQEAVQQLQERNQVMELQHNNDTLRQQLTLVQDQHGKAAALNDEWNNFYRGAKARFLESDEHWKTKKKLERELSEMQRKVSQQPRALPALDQHRASEHFFWAPVSGSSFGFVALVQQRLTMEHWEALQRAALSGDPEAEQLSGRIVGRLDTDQDRARYLAGYMQEAGDSEAWQGIYKAMEFDDKLEEQWRSLQAAALNMDRLAVLLAGVVQNRSKGEGQEAVTLQRLLKACHAQSWCDINYGVASALMNSIPALFDEEDLDSEQAGPVTGASPHGNDACEFERQEMERQRMFDARALEVKVDTYAPVSSDENDHYVGDMEAVADGDVVYFDRVNPVALDALGSLQISKVHRTGAHGPVLRVLGDVAVQCSRGCVKTFKAVFIEEKGMVELGMKGRRHSGRLTPKQVQAHGLGKFRGLAPCHLGTSIFCLPRFLRDVLRAGLKADCGANAEKMKKLKQANQQQWVPIEDMLAELTPGFFALFHLAYETLLWGRKMRTIGPVPAKCAALLEQELTDELGDAVKEFVLARLERATRLTAGAPAADIYSALQKHLETKMEEGKISVEVNGNLLKQAGLVEKRTKTVLGVDGKRRNVYVLLYRFPKADGGKDPIESGVKLSTGNADASSARPVICERITVELDAAGTGSRWY